MPVKWDATKDQHLLIQILDDPGTNITSATLANIAETWPASLGEAPTRRAISEHFVKLRHNLGAKPASATKKGSARTPGGKSASTPKDEDSTVATPMTPANSGTKRKNASTGTKTSHSRSKKQKVAVLGSNDEEEEAMTTDDAAEDLTAVSPSPSSRMSLERRSKEGLTQRLREAQKAVNGTETEADGTSSDDSDGSVFRDLPPILKVEDL